MYKGGSSNNWIIPLVLLAVLVLGGLALASANKKDKDSKLSSNSSSSKASDAMMQNPMVGGAAMLSNRTIVDNASAAPNLTTLVAAVKAADLVTTLSGTGPFTVFAPTNDAFAKLPAGTVETLVKPENKATLTKILTYHVVSGKYTATDLKDGMMLTTVQGEKLMVTKKDGKTMVGGVTISTADVMQSNGVVHVIDSILTPPSNMVSTVGGSMMYGNKDIIDNVVNAPNLATLVAAVKAAGLVETLKGAGPFTVFGPDNDAFAKLPAGTVENLIKPENKAALTKILTYHVVSGRYVAADFKDGMMLKTVQGQNLTVKVSAGKVMLMDSKGGLSTVTQADVMQSNGVAHVVDTVLMPN